MLTLSNDEIASLIRGEDLIRYPPLRKPTPELESFYAGLVKEITRLTGSAERTEWNHYGSGYASFIDAWFYLPDGRARGILASEHDHYGIYALLSRQSCFYVVGQGEKTWRSDGGSSYLPGLDSVDSVEHATLRPLERQIDGFLSKSGLRRLHRADLEAMIGGEHDVPTILSDAPFTQFDALFFWED